MPRTIDRPVGIMGSARAGKDTLAALVVERGGHFRRALADELKEQVGLLLFNLPDTLDNRRIAWERIEASKHLDEVRGLLQNYGVSKRLLVGEGYWICELFRYAEGVYAGDEYAWKNQVARIPALDPVPAFNPRRLVVPDVRFDNEIQTLRDRGFILVEVVREGAGLDGHLGQHSSEGSGRTLPPDYYIQNDAEPAWMYRQLEMCVAHAEYHRAAHTLRGLASPPGLVTTVTGEWEFTSRLAHPHHADPPED